MVSSSDKTSRVSAARLAGLGGLVAFVAFNAGWIAGDLAQPAAFSPANDDLSDLGALTASSPWLYNQLAANLPGLLVIALGVALWLALSPSRLARLGAAALIATGTGGFLGGLFRLDCQGIDAACNNDSWHSHAHKINSGFTSGASFAALLILAVAFRRIPAWRDSWLPTLAAIPAVLLASLAFSALGNGASARAASVTVFAAIAFIAFRLLQKENRSRAAPSGPPSGRTAHDS